MTHERECCGWMGWAEMAGYVGPKAATAQPERRIVGRWPGHGAGPQRPDETTVTSGTRRLRDSQS